MGIAYELAERIVGTNYDDLPEEAVYWCKIAYLDTIGVALAGTLEEAPRMVADVLGIAAHGGPSLVLGTNRRADCLDAALINGTAAHALDFDNGSNTMGGHVSATIVPAVLAAGDAFGGDGRDLVLAHAVGFETGTRIGRGANFQHYERGWHPTSTLGTFAVIGACAKILKLTVKQTETALALGTSLAAGIKVNFGTMTKPLHVGHCARNGLFAVLLARRGFTASPAAFEHKQGFLNVYNGEDNYDASRITAGWGDPLEIMVPGAGYKQYPCCAGTHGAVDAALKIIAESGPLQADRIKRIETTTPARRLAHTDRPDPQSDLDAKFSVQYCVTRALLSGKVVLEHFEGGAFRDATVQGVLPRVQARPNPPGEFPPDNHFGAVVKVTMRDGAVLKAKVDRQLGRSTDDPIPAERLRAKFDNCARRVLPAAATAELGSTIETLEALRSVRDLTALMEVNGAR